MGASYSLTKICVHTQGLQMNEINVIAKHIKPWYQTMHCIHTYKKSSPFRKWNMLHWIKEGHCEFYITYITQALLISDNKCSFFAKPTKRWKSCSGVNHFYIPLFNKTTGLEENKWNWFDFTRTFSKDIAKTNFTNISYVALLRVYLIKKNIQSLTVQIIIEILSK